MNENGYIRKIDELGRIVIPKEVRKKLRIHEGENLIINCSDKDINLSKYSYIENNRNFIILTGDKTNLYTGFNVIITDLENIIYSNIGYNNLIINNELKSYIESRGNDVLSELVINKEIHLSGQISIEPIIANSICIGLLILYTTNNNEYMCKIAKLIANIISIHVDEP